MSEPKWHILDPALADPARIRRERDKAAKLRKSQWWHRLVNRGVCHYCEKRFPALELTMDHVVPLARGGTSTPGNIVPACRGCNREKKLEIPIEQILENLDNSKIPPEDPDDGA